ncbi:MAG: hypothetical protein QOD55_2718 [Solirubrobacteraceae bacterium]|jgi:hypothetical protein|nr:hypothetical protein [Solirubrobacteraceae bacterium]MEA2290721.1 hypothetical protein [Solirubrobacteraceae bacterium]
MASVENVAAGARAVFFSIAYPDPQDGFKPRDAGSVFGQLDALFRAARAITDPQWLGSRAEQVEQQGAAAEGDGEALNPPPAKPSQEPLLRRVHMDWRHIEVVSELPWEFIVGGGLVGLVTMAEGVATVPPRVAVQISQLSAEQADWKGRRTPPELEVIEHLTKTVVDSARMRPAHTQIYLGEEDEFEGWTA